MGWQQENERRDAALTRLDQLVDVLGPELTRDQLRNVLTGVSPGHLVDRQKGIWNPNWLSATLSVLTVHDSPYPDEELGDGVWAYSYRRGSLKGDNTKLRRALESGVDIIYFQPASPRRYRAIYPVRVVEDYPDDRRVILVRRDLDRIDWKAGESEYLRSWAERTVLYRLHQDDFRKRIMHAYEATCAVCTLKYERLLDAAHIDSDRSEFGDPHTNNGLALCKLHHRAYDTNLLGISPDYRVRVAASVRRASDGPMLTHGLQEMHGRKLWLPRDRRDQPLPERLARRFEVFKAARVD